MLDKTVPASRASRQLALAILMSGLLGGGALVAEETAMPVSEQAVIAPKAASSMLLDVVETGAGRLVAVGERGHILYSDDQGRNWQQASVPSVSNLTAVYFVDQEQGWAVGHDASILMTQDGGVSWQVQYFKAEQEKPLLDVWFRNNKVGVAVGAYGLILRTEDGGKTWAVQETSSLGDDIITEPHFNALRQLSDGSLFMVGEAGFLARSRDDGKTWSRLNSPYEGSYFGIGETPGKAILIAGLRGHLFRSVDGAQSWSEIKTEVVGALNAVTSVASGTYVLGNDGVVLHSDDDGRSFSRVQRGDRKGIAAAVSNDGGLILVGESGAQRVDSTGQNIQD